MKISKSRIKQLINEAILKEMTPDIIGTPGAGGDAKTASQQTVFARGKHVVYSNDPNALKFKASHIDGVDAEVREKLKTFAIATTELAIAFSGAKIAIPYFGAKLVYTLLTTDKPEEIVNAIMNLTPGKLGKLLSTTSYVKVTTGLPVIKSVKPEEKQTIGKKIIEATKASYNKKVVGDILEKIKEQHPDIQ